GRIDAAALDEASARPSWAIVAIQAVNNETGVIQDIRAIGRQVRAAGHLFVVDAVQAIGRIEVDPADADILILSAHKVGGPQGVGAIVATAEGFDGSPLIRGGGQEKGRRAGTENVAGIAGFAAALKAATAATSSEAQRLGALRDRFEAGLIELAPDVLIAGAGAQRVGNTSCFSIPGVSAETALIAYDLEGIALSSGAACSSGRVRSSHVLSAMGVPADLVRGALRVSFGWTSTEADIERLLSVTARLLPRLRGSKARAA
ncbi:MAG: aminotransferase class V-fold PLP-dependent enzyme, partial [Alphaproteobacteria bacterium]